MSSDKAPNDWMAAALDLVGEWARATIFAAGQGRVAQAAALGQRVLAVCAVAELTQDAHFIQGMQRFHKQIAACGLSLKIEDPGERTSRRQTNQQLPAELKPLLGQRVRIFRDLSGDRIGWCIQVHGKTVARADVIRLRDVVAIINEAGRQLVIRHMKKRPHAYLEGILTEAHAKMVDTPPPDAGTVITYHPEDGPNFFFKATGRQFSGCAEVLLAGTVASVVAQVTTAEAMKHTA